MIEKVINGIDAVLMAKCFELGIDPEGADAPQTMAAAVERFFGVRDGQISNLDARQRQQLADNIHVVAVGSKTNPNYLNYRPWRRANTGQVPRNFSLDHEVEQDADPVRPREVQLGWLGHTSVLRRPKLSAYRIAPSILRRPSARTILRVSCGGSRSYADCGRPMGGVARSMSTSLQTESVPSFSRSGIRVLPGVSRANQPGEPYAIELPFGTCLKLYNFRWGRPKTIITLDARYEIERLLHVPALPFRLDETRDYSGNYFSTTVVGGWNVATGEDEGESTKLEEGFPAYAELNLVNVGTLPYRIAVYREGTKKRHVPHGVFFIVNGQVHGSLPADFVSRRLKFDYLRDDRGPLLVSVDCTNMDPIVREDFFMASRDRVRHNEVYADIEKSLTDELRNHPGLQEINQKRRQKEMERTLDEDASLGAFQRLLDSDPSLASLFAAGDRLVTTTGPAPQTPFVGRKFPSFFRLAKAPNGQVIKNCPTNRTCQIEFETDAVNDYFKRLDSPGSVIISPPNLLERQRLWNGEWNTRFRVPWDAVPGDEFTVTVTVTDVEREMRGTPFVSCFVLRATPEMDDNTPSGPPPNARTRKPDGQKTGVVLAVPKIQEVPKADWEQHNPPFNAHEAVRIKHDGQGGFDYFVNVDNAFLLTELSRTSDESKLQARFWFEYGLVLAAVGMIKHHRLLAEKLVAASNSSRYDEDEETEDLEQVNRRMQWPGQGDCPTDRLAWPDCSGGLIGALTVHVEAFSWADETAAIRERIHALPRSGCTTSGWEPCANVRRDLLW